MARPACGKEILAKAKGSRKILGLTHSCGTRRYGDGFRMKRVATRRKYVAKLQAFKEWLGSNRTLPTKDIWKTTISKLRGRYNYYGVIENYRGITRFWQSVCKLLFRWFNRRGRRRCLNWEKVNEFLKRFPLPKPRILVSMIRVPANTI